MQVVLSATLSRLLLFPLGFEHFQYISVQAKFSLLKSKDAIQCAALNNMSFKCGPG